MTVAIQHSTPADLIQLSEDSIAQGSKSFAAAARLFTPETRRAAVMLYAWCRHADDLIDGQTSGHNQQADFRTGQRARLTSLRQATQAALDGIYSQDPVFEALHQVVKRHDIPHRYPLELVRGLEMDAEERIYHSLDDTLDYCYHVAGVVGVMMSMIMGAREPHVLDRASDLGIAFQLTNIARDVIDDARAGRNHLPLDWLQQAGLDGVDPEDEDSWAALHGVALRLLDCAEPYYASAYKGIAVLPWRSAWAIAAARRVYRDIGEKLRKRGSSAWRNRVATSQARKLWLLKLSLTDVAATRFGGTGDTTDRTGLYQRPG